MGNILQEMSGKIKAVLSDRDSFVSVVLVLVALTSFGLGRQSMMRAEAPMVPQGATAAADRIEDEALAPAELPTTHYVASKNGQVYHLPHCSGAKNISEANKITFATKAEAEAAGYRPAQNCKGI